MVLPVLFFFCCFFVVSLRFRYYNNGPRWVCFHCFQDPDHTDKSPPRTGYQWRDNEFYDCCHNCEWRHKKKKKWLRLWYGVISHVVLGTMPLTPTLCDALLLASVNFAR